MALVNSKIRLVKSKEQEEEEKKRKQEEERRKQAQSDPLYLPIFEELNAIEEKAKEDAARVASSEKGLDFFQRPSNWDDGYQFAISSSTVCSMAQSPRDWLLSTPTRRVVVSPSRSIW